MYSRRWSKAAVPASVVNAVYTAWEMERYHAAERLLYPEVLDVLTQIKEEHPNVIIGAVTDGKANPLLMTFTLAPFFDFCLSWEDDQGKRSQFFKELSSVEGNADMSWIYEAAKEKYRVLSDSAATMKAAASGEIGELLDPLDFENAIWIHVGDDLAYDVGGSAACGAKTVLVDLVDKYGQTAKKRFFTDLELPAWSTSSREELAKHQGMNEAAEKLLDIRIDRLTRLPDAINKILEQDASA